MKNKKCPERKVCFAYKDNDCESCTFGEEFTKLHKRIDRLKKQKETLIIQRNAFALTAKALSDTWISVEDELPEVEVEVLILAIRKCATGREYQVITTAMYEDGTMSTDDSNWTWYDVDFIYDEENDVQYIPEGWWEYRHYNPDEVYNNPIDDKVTHWMPLPELPKESEDTK